MSDQAFNSERIQAIRDALDITQEQLARVCDVSPRTVHRWEEKNIEPQAPTRGYLGLLEKLIHDKDERELDRLKKKLMIVTAFVQADSEHSRTQNPVYVLAGDDENVDFSFKFPSEFVTKKIVDLFYEDFDYNEYFKEVFSRVAELEEDQ